MLFIYISDLFISDLGNTVQTYNLFVKKTHLQSKQIRTKPVLLTDNVVKQNYSIWQHTVHTSIQNTRAPLYSRLPTDRDKMRDYHQMFYVI